MIKVVLLNLLVLATHAVIGTFKVESPSGKAIEGMEMSVCNE